MKNLIFSLLLLLSFNANAQIDMKYLNNNWTNVHTSMLDGSRYIAEDSNVSYQWIFTNNLLVITNDPIIRSTPRGFEYKKEGNLLKISPFHGYIIEKLTMDSLVIIESDSNLIDKDKIKKILLLNTDFVIKQYKDGLKNKSEITAISIFSPKLREEQFLSRFAKKNFKFHHKVDFKISGNFIIYPKLKKVEFEITHLENASKIEEEIPNIIAKIETSYSDWVLAGFEDYEKVYVPCLLEMKYLNPPQFISINTETYKQYESSYYGRDISLSKEHTASRIIFPTRTRTKTRMVGSQSNDYDPPIYIYLLPNPNQGNFNKKNKRDHLSKENYKAGLLAFNKKKYQEAISYFEKSYEIDFSNLDALYNIAACYSQIGDTENLCKTLLKLKDLEQTEGTRLYNENCMPK